MIVAATSIRLEESSGYSVLIGEFQLLHLKVFIVRPRTLEITATVSNAMYKATIGVLKLKLSIKITPLHYSSTAIRNASEPTLQAYTCYKLMRLTDLIAHNFPSNTNYPRCFRVQFVGERCSKFRIERCSQFCSKRFSEYGVRFVSKFSY